MPPREFGFGFGGFPVVELDQLPDRGNRRACFYGVDVDIARRFGRSTDGAASFLRRNSARMVPQAVKRHRVNWLAANKRKIDERLFAGYDIGLLKGDAADVSRDITFLAAALAQRDYLPILIGGDHTASYWHAYGVSLVKEVTYVYIDAHLDIGLHRNENKDDINNGNFVADMLRRKLFNKIVNLGARSWSSYDPVYDDIDGLRLIRCTNKARYRRDLEFLRNQNLYISIDADAIDPSFIPNVACPEPFGFSPDSLLEVLHSLSNLGTVVGADLCEVTVDETRGYTSEIALRLLYELLM